MEIDKMEAGAELDKLVAEKVFGMKILTEDEMRAEAERVWNTEGQSALFFQMGFHAEIVDGVPKFSQQLPRYSEDIAAAWLVVDKLRAEGLYIVSFGNGCLSYGCTFARATHDWKPEFTGEGDTAPLAICHAALKAICPG